MPKVTAQNDESGPIYFWKPHESFGFLGQWYDSPFVSTEADGQKFEYQNAEQYMMHRKGLLFAPDSDVTASILEEADPKAIKALGRLIPNFDEETWKAKRLQIVIDGNYLKFTQDPNLREQLLDTGSRELVEASPRDRIWGIGFGAKNAGKTRGRWGLNLLGKALMRVREQLKEEAAKKE